MQCFFLYVGEKIRTPDLLVRSQTLYPAELHPHNATISHSKDYYILDACRCQLVLFTFLM